MKFIILILGAGGFIYSMIKKPEIISVVLFTIIIAQVDIPYIRPVLTLLLFGRVIIDKSTQKLYPSFLGLAYTKLLIIFLVYGLFVSLSQDSFNYDLLKGDIDMVMLTYCVYHFYFKNGGYEHLKWAIILSGLICFADLAYTYIAFGTFPIHRLYNLLIGVSEEFGDDDMFSGTNWNFFGQICGMCFVFVLLDYVRNRSVNKISLIIMPLMLMGVIMSTSRSAIMGLLIVTILIILSSINYKEQKRKLSKIGVFVTGAGIIAFLLVTLVGKYINLDTKFLDEVNVRLTEEPLAMLKKATGQSYNINNMGSMDWREESAANAYQAYLDMDIKEQLFGIGAYGFEKRNIGHGFNAHNASLLLLIEYGLVGFVMYFILIAWIVVVSIMHKNYSPALATIIFVIFYGLGQNREWTGWTMFIIVFCVVAEVQLIGIKNRALLNSRREKPVVIKANRI